MSAFESPYLKELTIYRNLQRPQHRSKRTLANLSLIKERLSDGHGTFLIDNRSILSCEKPHAKAGQSSKKQDQLERLQARISQFQVQAKKECQQLKNEDKHVGEELLRSTYEVYKTKLECLRLQRYLAELEREYDEEREAYQNAYCHDEEPQGEQPTLTDRGDMNYATDSKDGNQAYSQR